MLNLDGNDGPEMVCARCSRHFWPRVGAYWFLLLAPRGRCRFPHATEGKSVLCLECGRWLREQLESWGCTLAPAYDNAGKDWKGKLYDRHGEGDPSGVPGSDDACAG